MGVGAKRRTKRLLACRASEASAPCERSERAVRHASEASAREGGCLRDLSLAQKQRLFAQQAPPALFCARFARTRARGTHLSVTDSRELSDAAVLACRNFGRRRVGISLARVARGALRDAVDGAAVLAGLAVNAVTGAGGARRADVRPGRAGDAGRVVFNAVVLPGGADLATPALRDLTRTDGAGQVRSAAGVVRRCPRSSGTFHAAGLARLGRVPVQGGVRRSGER